MARAQAFGALFLWSLICVHPVGFFLLSLQEQGNKDERDEHRCLDTGMWAASMVTLPGFFQGASGAPRKGWEAGKTSGFKTPFSPIPLIPCHSGRNSPGMNSR